MGDLRREDRRGKRNWYMAIGESGSEFCHNQEQQQITGDVNQSPPR